MDKMRADVATNTGRTVGKYTIATADDFTYVDPVDGSVAKKQGIRFLMSDGSRVIFRLSGTAGSGATIRMYIEQYEPKVIDMVTSEALKDLVAVALELCDIKGFVGTETPTVITWEANGGYDTKNASRAFDELRIMRGTTHDEKWLKECKIV